MDWVDAYLRIPFRDGGRDRAGCDCWGIMRLVLAEQAGLELPSFDTVTAAGIGGTIAEQAEQWLPVEAGHEQRFDAVVMASTIDGISSEIHLGIVTRPGFVLHSEERLGPVHIPLRHPAIRHRVRRILRHKVLA